MTKKIKVDNIAATYGDHCGAVHNWDCPKCGESLDHSDFCGSNMMCKCGIWEFDIVATLDQVWDKKSKSWK